MGDRQPYMNGSNYGQWNPPPIKTYRRSESRGLGCCCFSCIGGCLRCCFCSILSLICNILITLAVLLAIAALAFWFFFRPNIVNFYVSDANLNQFSLDHTNNNLRYNLDLNFTIRNPNRRIGVYYDKISVSGYYGGQRFGTGDISPFYQGHKNTTVIEAKIKGQKLMVVSDETRVDLNEDEKSGIYEIDAKLKMSIRFRVLMIKSWRFRVKMKCNDLKIPLVTSNSARGFKFQRIKCDFDLF